MMRNVRNVTSAFDKVEVYWPNAVMPPSLIESKVPSSAVTSLTSINIFGILLHFCAQIEIPDSAV